MKTSNDIIITQVDGSIKKVKLEDYKVIPEGFVKESDMVIKAELPEGVQVIESYAFECCNLLETVVFPKSLVRIENYAFYDCRNLINVEYSEEVFVGGMAFYGCTSLLTKK